MRSWMGAGGASYPCSAESYNTNAEWVSGPENRREGEIIGLFCSGEIQRPVLKKMKDVTDVFQTGMFRREKTGRILETVRDGQVIREPEIATFEMPLTEGRILLRK